MKKVDILDCTLRDASYAIAYQFTAEDTAVIAAGLEAAGFTRIEVGHGVGLGASGPKYGSAAATEEEYLTAAASVLTTASFGAFVIPGIATLDHVRLAAKTGAGFVRVGTDVTATADAEAFIKLAKDLGLEVSANFMKTYAVPVSEVLRRAKEVEAWGADTVCVVDSAGGMLPADVRVYVDGLRRELNARVGFHGHNNMQLAVANTLAAVEAGAHIVDSTLRGLGRSSGNAQTEVLVMILQRLGIECGIDAYRAMDLGDKLVAPLAQGRGVDSVELVSGYAQFHSSFLGMLERVAHELQVDLRELIIRVSSVDKVKPTESLVRRSAGECQRYSQDPGTSGIARSFDFDVKEIAQGADLESASKRVADEMRTVAKKTGRCTVFTIAMSPSGRSATPVFPFIRLSAGHVIGNVEVPSSAHAEEVARGIDGIADFVLVDAEVSGRGDLLRSVGAVLQKSRLLTYRDADAQIDATEALVGQLFAGVASLSIGLCGLSPFAMRLGIRLLERGACLLVWDEDEALAKRSRELLERWCESQGWSPAGRVNVLDPGGGVVDLLVGARAGDIAVSESLIDCVRKDGAVLDAGIGTLSASAVDRARERGLRLYRLDMRAGLTGQVAIAIETSELLSNVIGQSRVAGIDVVAGGMVGRSGTVVLDAIRHPTRVVGVADGRGQLMSTEEALAFADSVARVRKELVRQRLPWSIATSAP